MATQNGINVVAKTADIELTYGTQTGMGFLLVPGTKIQQSRGSGVAGQISSGATTYQDASPFKRIAFEDFGGGFGQVQYNRAFGGTGKGGDPSRYFAGDAYTARGAELLPGMTRTILPVNGLSPTMMEWAEYEIPRGVLPSTDYRGTLGFFHMNTNTTTITLNVLLRLNSEYSATSVTVQIFDVSNTLIANFTATPAQNNRAGYQWVQFSAGSAVTLNTGMRYSLKAPGPPTGLVWGCWVGQLQILPYFQIVRQTGNTDFWSWKAPALKTERITYSGLNLPIGVTNNSWYAATVPSTETVYTAPYTITGTTVFDNNFYVGTNNGSGGTITYKYVAANVYSGGAAAGTNNTFALGPASYHGGLIYFVDGVDGRTIKTWNGDTATNPTTIIAADKVGKASSNSQNNITNILIYRGLMYLFKPEGVFQVYAAPDKVTTNDVPRINQIVNFQEHEHYDNCKWVVEHQGALYFNVRNMVYQLNMSDMSGNQLSVLVPPWPLAQTNTYDYCNGLTSDGQVLYMSYANRGVVAFTGQGYHPICDFYNVTSANSTGCALRFVGGSTATSVGYLCVSDGKHYTQVTIPNYTSTYTSQFNSQQQNKTMLWVSSVFDGDLAEIIKYIYSVTIKAFPAQNGNNAPSYWTTKVIAAIWQGDNSNLNYRKMIQAAIDKGLQYDRWVNPLPVSYNPYNSTTVPSVVTHVTAQVGVSTYTDGGLMSTVWYDSDFAVAGNTSEKPVQRSQAEAPASVVNCALVVYGWDDSYDYTVYPPTTGHYTTITATAGINYYESIIVKYEPIQDYISRYEVTLDLENTPQPPNGSGYGSVLQWLSTLALLKQPVHLTYQVEKNDLIFAAQIDCILDTLTIVYEGATTSGTIGEQPALQAHLVLIAIRPGLPYNAAS